MVAENRAKDGKAEAQETAPAHLAVREASEGDGALAVAAEEPSLLGLHNFIHRKMAVRHFLNCVVKAPLMEPVTHKSAVTLSAWPT